MSGGQLVRVIEPACTARARVCALRTPVFSVAPTLDVFVFVYERVRVGAAACGALWPDGRV